MRGIRVINTEPNKVADPRNNENVYLRVIRYVQTGMKMHLQLVFQ